MQPESQTWARSGIAGLDGVLHGGFLAGRSTLIIGGPGSGKTVLAMEFLAHGVTDYNEPGIIVSFEESAAALRANCRRFGWSLDGIFGDGLHIIDGRIPAEAVHMGDFDLSGLVAILDNLIKTTGAKRIAIDGLDAVFGMASDQVQRRELQRLLEWLDTRNLTTLITMKPGNDDGDSVSMRFEQAEYAADAVIRLSSRLDERLLQRLLRVVKIRGSDFASGDHACLISEHGFSVAYTDILKAVPPLSKRRISTGVARLDQMLAGGFREGSMTLISGLPGTAKTSLGGSFLAATLARGERALLIAFDEPAEQIMSDLMSVNIHLEQYQQSGTLRTVSLNPASAIGDVHVLAIERLVAEHQPAAIMIDPITALEKAGGKEIADRVSDHLANSLKARGITAVFTAVGESRLGELETASTRILTTADTWIHLSYAMTGGERNRMLTVIKSRGTGHSNQVRELILSDAGITLDDVYLADGDFLLGTARLQREQRDIAERSARDSEFATQVEDLRAQRTAATARIGETQREIDALDERLKTIKASAHVVNLTEADDRLAVRDSRDSRG